jgi:hypothetical protein
MREKYEIAPTTSSSSSASATALHAASILRRISRISFWSQIVLGVISAVLLLIASASYFGLKQRTQGIEVGILCAFGGVILLAAGIIFALRYGRMAKAMVSADASRRPKKSETLQLIRTGLIMNLGGMFLSILGAQALAGIVLLKILTLPQGSVAFGTQNLSQFVNPVDLIIVQANTNSIMAHFAGIATSLWLLQRLTNLSR